MNEAITHDFLAMMIIPATDRSIQDISFFAHDTGFGTLEGASLFPGPYTLVGGQIEWIRLQNLVKRLAQLIPDLASLCVLCDFEGTILDENGIPYVWRVDLTCEGCAKSWHTDVSHLPFSTPCPRCKTTVRAWPEDTTWTGPAHPALKELWLSLNTSRHTIHQDSP